MAVDAPDTTPYRPAARRIRVRRAAVAVALILVIALGLGGALVAQALRARVPPHLVLYARFSTDDALPAATARPDVYELWTDPTRGSVRMRLERNGDALYYQRSSTGAWYVVDRPSPRAPWQRIRLLPGQEPSLLTERGVRALFARLRKSAGAALVTPVDLRNHLAYAFPSGGVTWPYRYVGATRVWVDGVTGLPLQYRNVVVGGTQPVVILTVVGDIRTVSSTSLPADFFTPPTQAPSPWDRFVQSVASWLQARLGMR
jgi:hypothetical protein